MKPRFPLSVERHFCFRAYQDYGDILESDSFKSVYKASLCGLRCAVGKCANGWDVYLNISAGFEWGYLTTYQIDETHFYREWVCIKKIGILCVSPVFEWFNRFDTDNGFDFNRADYTERRGHYVED